MKRKDKKTRAFLNSKQKIEQVQIYPGKKCRVMKIGLLQELQNELYDFGCSKRKFSFEKAKAMQTEMSEQNLSLLEAAGKRDCDLIITSESVNFCGQPWEVDGDWDCLIPEMESAFFQRFAKAAAQAKSYLIVGAMNKRKACGGFQYFNSAFLFNREGKLLDIYDKVHLAGTENDYLTSGNRYCVLGTDFGKIGVCICWDMQFPETCRELTLMGAQIVVCPTWGWEQIYGHARAYENGIFVASAMAVPFGNQISGLRTPSEVVSPAGRVLASASREKAQILTKNIDLSECTELRAMRLSGRRPQTYNLLCHEFDEVKP